MDLIIRDDSRCGTDTVGPLTLSWAANSDVGRVRESNEDAASVRPGKYFVADGMGGHESGEVASETALRAFDGVVCGGDRTETQTSLIDLLTTAQQQIDEIDPGAHRRAGTTATGVVLVTHDDRPHWLVLNIGDSRTYRYAQGVLEQVTVDHSQVQEFIDAGFITAEQARTDPRRNVITRALGAGMIAPEADFYSFPAVAGDVLLMCTDGLTGELPDGEIEEILAEMQSPKDAVAALVAGAHALGAHDNVTVVMVAVSDAVAEDADGDATVPAESDGTGPAESAADTTDPAAPDTAAPDTAEPVAAAPDAAVPDAAVPDTAVPTTGDPADAAPETAAPDAAAEDASV
ncbi:protein phosphatase [Gordonia amarae]|uniref:Putative serine/threonine protein phosphatase n=1 Tax=Gordonia amarae NBRC 15530 TaxID=1075090 RepID=G7GL67_9ACTN|nr:protein phosphatase 2C domain-containing protein [Gordonia amarae]MCS3878868.1 protein phosphatase [Gordonia amarae]GAB04342.1 putative serine/threonine protein phosphatase [Gordonia amarae NBRC 15530]